MNTVEIPQGIDDPPQVLLWDLTELAPIVLGLVVGMIANRAMLFLGIGLIAVYAYRRVRDRHADGFFIHALYWAGLPLKKARTLPNPFIRRYVY